MTEPSRLGPLAFHVRTLAQNLFSLHTKFEIAFLCHKANVHWSARALAHHEPHSSVTDLIQGLFQRLQDQSFFVLRERIYTTSEASAFDRAMVKVAAKRMSDRIEAVSDPSKNFSDFTFVHECPAPVSDVVTDLSALWAKTLPASDEDWLRLCSRLANSVERGQVLHRYHRPIAALIVSPDQQILSAATHEGALDKTQHAELRAVQSWFAANKRALPPGCLVYVSLKPCRMCAEALVRVSQDADQLKIIYLNDDPGPHARATVLNSQIEQKSASALTVLEGETQAFAKRPSFHRHD